MAQAIGRDRRSRRLRFLLVLCVVPATAFCGGGGPATLSTIEADIFSGSCSSRSCHGDASPKKGLSLSGKTHARLVGVASTERPERMLVVAGQPEASFLVDKILDRNLPPPPEGETWTFMPPVGRLDAASIDRIVKWIQDGALDN